MSQRTLRRTILEWSLLIVVLFGIVAFVLGLVSCTSQPKLDQAGRPIPVLDEQGQPVLDAGGNPVLELETVVDPDKMQSVGDVASKILPWPWNLIVAGGIGVATTVLVSKRRAPPKEESTP